MPAKKTSGSQTKQAAKQKPTINWAPILKEVKAQKKSLSQIAKQHDISLSSLYRRRREWIKSGLVVDHAPKAQAKRSEESPEQMINRLYQATERQINHLEERLKTGDANFDEKEARMLGTIARTLDKLMDLKAAQSKSTPRSTKTKAAHDTSQQDTKDRDLDSLRQDLARRIEQLRSSDESALSGLPLSI